MATAALPIRMVSQQPFHTKSPLASPAASSSRSPEASTASSIVDVLPEPLGKPFGKIRSQLEQTLRSATRSKAKGPSPPAEDFATIRAKTEKEKEKASLSDEVPRVHKEGGRSRVLRRIESKMRFRSRKESVTQSPSPIPNIGKTKDGGGKNMKIQERARVDLTGFIPPSLRQASTSSPALHLSSQAIPSPKLQPAVPASSSSTTSVLVSPPKDRTRRSSFQQPPSKDISIPIPLSAKRNDSIVIGHTKESKTSRKCLPLGSPPSPSLLTSSQPHFPSASPTTSTSLKGYERPRTPESPTPRPSRSQHKKAAANMGNIPLKTPPTSSTTVRAGSPTMRVKSPPTRARVQRGFTSASTSELPLNPSPTPPRPSFESQRRLSVDASRPSIDSSRRPSVDGQHRPSVDAPRRPSVDTSHRPSDSPRTMRATSPSTHVRPRPISPNRRENSPSYAHFNLSTSSLVPTSTPEQRELIRSATSILCKELRKAPPHLSGNQSGLREWEGVEHRLQHLIRVERIWGKSGSTLGPSSSQLSVAGGVNPSGLSAGGEERERRLFADALRDGFILCQCVTIHLCSSFLTHSGSS